MAKPEIKPGDKERLARKAYDQGYYYQNQKRCCSQTAVAAVMETLGLKDHGIFKASTALAGGGALFGDAACGGYSGGLLIIGMLKGRPMDNFVVEDTDRFRCFEIGRALHKKFIDNYGTVFCRDIMTKVYGRPFWLVDPDEYKKAEEAGAHSTVSPEVVGNAAKWVVEVIFEENLLDELNGLRKK
jgi:hypothetical protein